MLFSDFNFEAELSEGIESMGFDAPTPIQQQAMPVILENKDLIACAQTGTGKTAAYLLPVINKIIKKGHHGINTLIIVPTRELAIQIDQAIQAYTYFTEISAMAIYGGNDGNLFEQEKNALRSGADILVATPGRLLAHIGQGYAKFDSLQHLVLDEADRMLDMGFSDDINRIISVLPVKRQTLMFSATMAPKIRTLAKRLLVNPVQINIALSKPAEGIKQSAYLLYESQKIPLLKEILREKNVQGILIFSSTKENVKKLEQVLLKAGFNVAAMHSDLEQSVRTDVVRRFSNREIQILLATDILSRGIDIDSIGLVINYNVPRDAEDYIHRVGRTARAEATGEAITFIDPSDLGKFKKIEALIGAEIEKSPLPAHLNIETPPEPEKRERRDFRNAGRNKKNYRR